jgi:hypothetical protein
LGIPITTPGFKDVRVTDKLILGNRHAQEFQGGFIYHDPDTNAYKKVLNRRGIDKLEQELLGGKDQNVITSFIEGIIEGVKNSLTITSWQDVVDIFFTVATLLASGPIAIAITVGSLIFGLVSIVTAVVQNWEAISQFITGGIAAIATLSGLILGGLIVGLAIERNVSALVENVVDSFRKFGKLGRVLDAIGDVPENVSSGLNKLAKSTKYKDFLNDFANKIEADPSILNKIKGNLGALDDTDIQKVLIIASKTDETIDLDEIGPLLSKLTGNLNDLSAEQLKTALTFARKRAITVDAAAAKLWRILNPEKLDELTNGELDELLPFLNRGELFDAGGFRQLQISKNISIAQRVYQLDTSFAGISARYTGIDLRHIIKGNPDNLGSGLHLDMEVLNRFDAGDIRVRLASNGQELTNKPAILSAIKNKQPLQFKDVLNNKPGWSAKKSLFSYKEYSVEDVALLAEKFRTQGVRGTDPSNPESAVLHTSYKDVNITLEGYITPNDFVSTMYLVY